MKPFVRSKMNVWVNRQLEYEKPLFPSLVRHVREKKSARRRNRRLASELSFREPPIYSSRRVFFFFD